MADTRFWHLGYGVQAQTVRSGPQLTSINWPLHACTQTTQRPCSNPQSYLRSRPLSVIKSFHFSSSWFRSPISFICYPLFKNTPLHYDAVDIDDFRDLLFYYRPDDCRFTLSGLTSVFNFTELVLQDMNLYSAFFSKPADCNHAVVQPRTQSFRFLETINILPLAQLDQFRLSHLSLTSQK